jgi:hypothetical protein
MINAGRGYQVESDPLLPFLVGSGTEGMREE